MKTLFKCPFCKNELDLEKILNSSNSNLEHELKQKIEKELSLKHMEEIHNIKIKAEYDKKLVLKQKEQQLKNEIEFKLKKDFDNQIKKHEVEIRNKVLEEVTHEQKLKMKATNNTSSILEGNSFEEYIFEKLKLLFASDAISLNTKKSANGDILHKIFFNEEYGTILYEVKTGKFEYTSFVNKLKSDMEKHTNILGGIFITKELPYKEMKEKNLKFLVVPNSKIYIIQADELENYIELIHKILMNELIMKTNLKNNHNLNSEQKKQLELITDISFKQAFTDFANNIKNLEMDIEKESQELIKIIETRKKKQFEYLKKSFINSGKIIEKINGLMLEIEKEIK